MGCVQTNGRLSEQSASRASGRCIAPDLQYTSSSTQVGILTALALVDASLKHGVFFLQTDMSLSEQSAKV